jgi:transposase-like protein
MANVVKHGKTTKGKQRYLCQNPKCHTVTFVTDNAHKGRLAENKATIMSMSINGSGIRDIARVLEIKQPSSAKSKHNGDNRASQ